MGVTKLLFGIINVDPWQGAYVSGGQKKTRRTLDAYRLKTINAINIIFHTCIAQSVPSNYVKFYYSKSTSFDDNVQDVPYVRFESYHKPIFHCIIV